MSSTQKIYLATVFKCGLIAITALMVMIMTTRTAEAATGSTLPIEKAREGMISVISFMQTRSDIFPPEKMDEKQLFTHEQRRTAWQIWQSFLDHVLALDTLGQHFSEVYSLIYLE